MKMIGLIGGMSWESSAEYYRIINQGVRAARGATVSARCLLWSFDFSEIARLQHKGEWETLTAMMVDAARKLEAAGADTIVICTNTMHLMADAVQNAVQIPLIHIEDPTAVKIKAQGLSRVGLLGTAFTMEQDFYKGRLKSVHWLDILTPGLADRKVVHDIIYKELVAGIVTQPSRAAYRDVIARLVENGAQAIILGCTEIMLLVQAVDCAVPLFDTTALHAQAAIDFALSGLQS
jgi:aspartate racemase